MIRRAVEQDIASDTHEDSAGAPDLSGQLSEIIDNLQRVDNRLQEFDRRLQSVEQGVKDDPELRELVNDVFALLPESEDEITQAAHQSQLPGEIPSGEEARSGRVEDTSLFG